MMDIIELKKRLCESKLFKDSFWSVFGNGLGNFLLLLAGIIIARMLGKDLYGEYGMVKTTMFHIASFSTLGLGFTSTKYIAQALSKAPNDLRIIIRTSILTTLGFSIILCILLFSLADSLADFINEPQTENSFKALGIIVVLRAINTISIGILAGYKSFKTIGINSIISGCVLLISSAILTYTHGLIGSYIALSLSQLTNSFLNIKSVAKHYQNTRGAEYNKLLTKEMLCFTIPVAIQEFAYMLATWGGTMILTKYASLGEVALWTAASQWNTIILFIPNLLLNIVLSYLSGVSKDVTSYSKMLRKMLTINFLCAFIPFMIVYLLADAISSLYGITFMGLKEVMRVLIFSTVLSSLSNVFHSSLLSNGRNWLLLSFRVSRDILIVVSLWLLLQVKELHASLVYSWIYVAANAIYFIMLASSEIMYYTKQKRTQL